MPGALKLLIFNFITSIFKLLILFFIVRKKLPFKISPFPIVQILFPVASPPVKELVNGAHPSKLSAEKTTVGNEFTMTWSTILQNEAEQTETFIQTGICISNVPQCFV